MRFNSDSNKSPAIETLTRRKTTRNPTTGPICANRRLVRTISCGKYIQEARAARNTQTYAPSAPSQLFFGLMAGAIRWRPNAMPTKKAKMSATQAMANTESVKGHPPVRVNQTKLKKAAVTKRKAKRIDLLRTTRNPVIRALKHTATIASQKHETINSNVRKRSPSGLKPESPTQTMAPAATKEHAPEIGTETFSIRSHSKSVMANARPIAARKTFSETHKVPTTTAKSTKAVAMRFANILTDSFLDRFGFARPFARIAVRDRYTR